eukprot:1159500-Pelagomonas_calceolata.AAC.16
MHLMLSDSKQEHPMFSDFKQAHPLCYDFTPTAADDTKARVDNDSCLGKGHPVPHIAKPKLLKGPHMLANAFEARWFPAWAEIALEPLIVKTFEQSCSKVPIRLQLQLNPALNPAWAQPALCKASQNLTANKLCSSRSVDMEPSLWHSLRNGHQTT